MHTPSHTNAGLTFIELLLYMSIALLMVALLGRIGVDVLESRFAAEARAEINYHSSFISEELRAAFDAAEAVVTPEAGTSSSSLVLSMREASIDPTTYWIAEGTLWKQAGEEAPIALTAGSVAVTGLQFGSVHQTDEPGSVWVEVLLEDVQEGNAYAVLRTAFSLRFTP